MVLGVGTRWSDFTTASRTAFQHPDVRFVNLNVAAFDAVKHAGAAARRRRAGWPRGAHRGARRLTASTAYRERPRRLAATGTRSSSEAYTSAHQPLPAQSEVIGVVNAPSAPRDVVVCAAGSMPGDLHKLWRTRDPKGYHVEYGYSCMGYEIAGGARREDGRARPRGVRAGRRRLVPDDGPGDRHRRRRGHQAHVVLVQNHGFQSIGALSESRRLAALRHRVPLPRETGRSTATTLPVDLAANAASLGRDGRSGSTTIEEFGRRCRGGPPTGTTVVQIETDPLAPVPVLARAGGTCRWPRSPRSTPRGRPAAYERAQGDAATAARRPRPQEGPREDRSTHCIGGKPTAGASTPHRPGLQPGDRRAAGRGRCSPSAADVDAAVQPRRDGVRELDAVVAVASARKVMFAFRELVNARTRRARRDHLRRARQDRLRRPRRGPARHGGRRVRLRDPAAAQGRVLRPGLDRRRPALLPPAAGRVRRDHAVQLPDHGPDVDAPGGDRHRQHVRAQAERARPVAPRLLVAEL